MGSSSFVSLSDNIQETFGITPIEGMASGLPVLVTEWDGYKSTVRDGVDGYVVDTNDVKQTSEKLDLLIKNSSKTKIMGENAAEYIKQNFSIETEAKKLIGHIRHVQNTEII